MDQKYVKVYVRGLQQGADTIRACHSFLQNQKSAMVTIHVTKERVPDSEPVPEQEAKELGDLKITWTILTPAQK